MPEIRDYFKYLVGEPHACDFSVGCIFMWRDYYKTKYAVINGTLTFEFTEEDGTISYTYPLGDPERAKAAAKNLIDAKKSLCFCLLNPNELCILKSLSPDGEANFDRQWCDYVYSYDDIKELKGRRFSGQRNHINKFKKLYPDWRFEAVDSSNIHEFKAFFESFYRDNPPSNESLEAERIAVFEQIENFSTYGQFGGILHVGDKSVGASLGEVVGDTMIVHTEKARREFEGAYPMLVNLFAKEFARDGVVYINREEDCGEEGLRTSKLSYHPLYLLEKWNYYI